MKERAFISAWAHISKLLLLEHGSMGSRLHRGSDGLWYGYAQWPSSEARDRAFDGVKVDPEVLDQLRSAILESLPEVTLEPVADFLINMASGVI